MANSFQDNIVSDLREGSTSNSANGMNRSTSSHNAKQTNKHVLSNCGSLFALDRFKTRHDSILAILIGWIIRSLKPDRSAYVDLEGVQYKPLCELFQSMRPDIAILGPSSIDTLELTGFHLQSSSSDVQIGVFDFHRFRKVSTVWATITMITIDIFLLAAVLPLNWYCTYTQKCHISAFSIAIYLNVGTTLLTLVLQQYIQCQNEMIRRHGYGVFYRLSAKYMKAPFVIFSFGNILMLLYQSVLRDVDCMFQVCSMSYTIQYAVLQILVGLEVLSTLPFLFVYLARTIKFNALEQTPDVFRDNPLAQDTVSYRRVIGIRDQTLTEETLERQSDQIYYLQTRCEHLTRELYEVVAQLDCLRPSEDLQMSGHDTDDRLIEA